MKTERILEKEGRKKITHNGTKRIGQDMQRRDEFQEEIHLLHSLHTLLHHLENWRCASDESF